MGGWAVAQSPILGTTITISRLKRKGYVPMIDYLNKEQTSIWLTACYENRMAGGTSVNSIELCEVHSAI